MFCKNCGTAIPDDLSFCPNCGTPVSEAPVPVPVLRTPADDALRIAKRNMNWERKAWKISGFVLLGIMIFVALYIAIIFGGTGMLARYAGAGSSDTRIFSIMGTLYAIFAPLLYLPIVIVSFHMNKVLGEYAEQPDNRNTLAHISSVGNIVFCAIFSTPALVFTIINFVHYKTHRDALESLRQ